MGTFGRGVLRGDADVEFGQPFLVGDQVQGPYRVIGVRHEHAAHAIAITLTIEQFHELGAANLGLVQSRSFVLVHAGHILDVLALAEVVEGRGNFVQLVDFYRVVRGDPIQVDALHQIVSALGAIDPVLDAVVFVSFFHD